MKRVDVTHVIVGLGVIKMSNKEYVETLKRTESFVGALCLYSMVFVITGLFAAFL